MVTLSAQMRVADAIPFLEPMGPVRLQELADALGLQDWHQLLDRSVTSMSIDQIRLLSEELAHYWESVLETPLNDLLPSLKQLGGVKVGADQVSVRLFNVLFRHGKTDWAELGKLCLKEALAWRNSGRLTVEALLEHAIHQALAPLSSGLALSLNGGDGGAAVAAQEFHKLPTLLDVKIRAALEEIAAWAWAERGCATLPAALHEVTIADELSREVQESWTLLESLDLWELGGTRRERYDLQLFIEVLRSEISERSLRILLERPFSLERRLTLDHLGRGLGLTRERVRQMEVKTLEALSERLRDSTFDVVRRAGRRLGTDLGVACPVTAFDGSLPDSLELDDPERFRWGLLLWLAGPYRRSGDWLVKGSASELDAATLRLVSEIMTEGLVPEQIAADSLEHLDIRSEFREAWLQRQFRVDGGFLLSRSASLADRAEAVLKLRMAPLTKEELVEALGSGANIRTLGNYLLSDSRFMRTGLAHYALREWELEEYTGIVDEIAQEIERQGGEANLQHLVNTLTSNFGVSEYSVRAYAASAHFVRTNRGTLRPAVQPAELQRRRSIELTKRCFRSEDGWGVRVKVTNETLRGSGCSISPAIGKYLGLRHGETKMFKSSVGDIRISWISLQVAISSLRPQVELLGGEVDDYLFVFFGSDQARVELVERTALDASEGLDRLALEVGITKTNEDLVGSIGHAIGLERNPNPDDLVTRLRMRGEDELAALVPLAWQSNEQSSLDRLTEVLGRATGSVRISETDDPVGY